MPTPIPTTDCMVIFGITGDLAKLETFPALHDLVARGRLDVPVLGVARSGWDLARLRDYATASLGDAGIDTTDAATQKLLGLLDYHDGDFGEQATYDAVRDWIGDRTSPLYYLEIPPLLFGRVVQGLATTGKVRHAKVMIEKPFGTDLTSAEALDDTVEQVFPETHVYRVDHWLGIEGVDNAPFVRFANTMLEPVMNRQYVDHIQLTMAEDFGVSDRGRFYDATGAIRDVLQNHLLQVLATVTMDPPSGTGPEAQRDARVAVVNAIAPLGADQLVRGQYEGYLDVDGVARGSTVETFAAVRCTIDNWRWGGVPVVIRAGKCLPVRSTEVVLRFRRPPADVLGVDELTQANALRFRVDPDSRVQIDLVGKAPGGGRHPRLERLVFCEAPGEGMRPYDRLIGAAMAGDTSYFVRLDFVEATWRMLDPVLDDTVPVERYACGSWGPASADRLLPAGVTWYDPS